MPNPPDHAALFDVLCQNMVAVMNGQPVDSNEFFCRLDKQVNPRRRNYTDAEFAQMVRLASIPIGFAEVGYTGTGPFEDLGLVRKGGCLPAGTFKPTRDHPSTPATEGKT